MVDNRSNRKPNRRTVSPTDCVICGGPRTEEIAGPPDLVRCTSCGVVSLEEMPTFGQSVAGYQDAYYEEGTGLRFLGPLEAAVRWFRRRRMKAVLRLKPEASSILDIGCGRGVLLELFSEQGWATTGTQLSETAAEAARRRCGLNILTGQLPELELPAKSFRVITFYHVLEHVYQPDEYLRTCRQLLEDGGLLIVEVPNYASPGFRLLGLRNLCVDHPHHLHFFTPESLRNLLEKEGFDVESVSHFSLEYSPITTLQNLLNTLPGRPNRFLDALKRNEESQSLRRQPLTWLHMGLAVFLALPAFVVSLAGIALPVGNTIRFQCRASK